MKETISGTVIGIVLVVIALVIFQSKGNVRLVMDNTKPCPAIVGFEEVR